jgi:hypothetical protein
MADLRAQIAAAMFQPISGGFLFREPFRLFSTAPHYLVDEAQKDQLVAITIPILWQIEDVEHFMCDGGDRVCCHVALHRPGQPDGD